MMHTIFFITNVVNISHTAHAEHAENVLLYYFCQNEFEKSNRFPIVCINQNNQNFRGLQWERVGNCRVSVIKSVFSATTIFPAIFYFELKISVIKYKIKM